MIIKNFFNIIYHYQQRQKKIKNSIPGLQQKTHQQKNRG